MGGTTVILARWFGLLLMLLNIYIYITMVVNDVLFGVMQPNNKGRGMCYPVFGMVHIKDPLMLSK